MNRNPEQLWKKAFDNLSTPDKAWLLKDSPNRQTPSLEEIIQYVKLQQTRCMEKRWKIEINGKTVYLRDVCDKIIQWINKFKQIGDIVMQYDPGHAALPWAAFRLLLQVCGVGKVLERRQLLTIDRWL